MRRGDGPVSSNDHLALALARLFRAAWPSGQPLPAALPGSSLVARVAVLEEAVTTLKTDYERLETKLNVILAGVVLAPFIAVLVQRFLLR